MTPAAACAAVALFSLAADAVALQKKALRAGVHEVDISPRTLPVILSGGFLARSVKDVTGPLKARALVLDDGERRVVISVADTLMMPRELLDEVKSAASRATGIPAERMLISATHTHSAPPLMGALGTDADPEYVAFVRGRLVEAIAGAAGRMKPARVGWATAQAPEQTNCRRWILRPDKMRKDPFGDLTVRAHMHPGYQNPEFVGPAGPEDPELVVFAVQSAEGKPVAVLANYSMHYVGTDRGVSPDYYGPFCEDIRRMLGVAEQNPDFIAMMSQGTSGDQHWMDYSQPKKDMNTAIYAEALAQKAMEAYRKIQFRDWATVDARETKLTFARRAPDARRLEWARDVFRSVPDGKPRNQVEVYAREQILLSEEPRRELKLQAMRIGEMGIAAWPNEVFAISGLKIKAQSPLDVTFNIELANGAEGYIPPPEQHRLGGYTTWPARTAALETGAEPRIAEELLRLLEAVSGKRRKLLPEARDEFAKTILNARPEAFWRGDEISGADARDSSGNRRTGEYTGGVALYLEGARPGGHAPHYAGGFMKAALPNKGEYSVAMWFHNGLPSDARATTGVLYSWGGDRLSIGGSSRAQGRLVFEAGGQALEGRTTLAANTWYFAVVTRGKDTVAVHLNGAETAELSGAVSASGQGAEFRAGAAGSPDSTFEGKLDEIAVFDRPLKPREFARFYR